MFLTRSLVLLVAIGGSFARNFNNPVIDGIDNPDPGVLLIGDTYWAVTTSMQQGVTVDRFPIHTSKDLQNWKTVGVVFPVGHQPIWAMPDKEWWAPEIHFVNGQLMCYFAARDKTTNRLAIGAAVATNNDPTTWVAQDKPILLDPSVDSIDATVLDDGNGNYHLAWASNGSFVIYSRPLSPDGLSVSDPRTEFFRASLPWESNVDEGPWHVHRGDYHYIFYSGQSTFGEDYAVGVARSKSVIGPYEKKGDPILHRSADWLAPGHCSVVRDQLGGNDTWAMVYHAYRPGQVGGNRLMMTTSMYWDDGSGWPYFIGM